MEKIHKVISENIISVKEAKQLVEENITRLSPITVPLRDAHGLVLAGDVIAPIDIPGWSQSSMDGYAFRFTDWHPGQTLRIGGEVPAGSKSKEPLATGSVMRIFTGAPLPEGADTVVMQEKTSVRDGMLSIQDESLQPGSNVRPRGSEISRGQTALETGELISPAGIGFLAGLGINEVTVFPMPHVCIIVTGNELQKPGEPLQAGKIYDSNSWSLQAALSQAGIEYAEIVYAEDKLETLSAVIRDSLVKADLVLLTGGVSVGDYDFVATAAEQNGIERIFHRVKQRPGKPLFFGKKENKFLFGLPGNPASALSCLYVYVEPALKQMAGQRSSLRTLQVPLEGSFRKSTALTHFLKGYYNGSHARLLQGQESFRLSSFAKANCLIRIGESTTECRPGDSVEIILFR